MATLTAEETRSFVEKLIASGRGDLGRLRHILNMLNGNRGLYNSDQKYIDAILADEIGAHKKMPVDNDLTTKIQNLISSGLGDTGRLQFILECIHLGKTLYKSDKAYLEGKLGQKIVQEIPVVKKAQESIMESLKSQVTLANERIANLEQVLQNKMSRLETLQSDVPAPPAHRHAPGAMPKGWKASPPSDDIQSVQQQIDAEQAALDKGRAEANRLKIEQSKLMQIILNRKEFEKQLQIEQAQLQAQIESERKAVQEQTKLAEQIKAQELELGQAKKERDEIVEQLREEQQRLVMSLGQEKQALAQVKTEYEKISSEVKQQEIELARQIEQERLKLAEQARLAQKIQQEKEQLEHIREEHEKIMRATASREKELTEQVRKEKTKMSAQEKLLRQISGYEKYLESSKQKQALLAAKIDEQKTKLQKTSVSVSQVREEQELLDRIADEKSALEHQIATAESEIKNIKKEKTSLERQLKTKKTKISKTRKLNETKVKSLKQKKKSLEKQIRVETTRVKNLGKSLQQQEP